MIIGIVGSEALKFTPETEALAKDHIRRLISDMPILSAACSGECPLGGIDIWTREIALELGYEFIAFPPAEHNWSNGYKPRNIDIAETSDKLVCIVPRVLPESYKGMRFPYCYHCQKDDHVKSGGCWTMHYATGLGKETELIIVG